MKDVCKQIILASASPRRRELLKKENFDFIVEPSGAEENNSSENFVEAAVAIALAMARDIAGRHPSRV
ncbi:MAG: Maf family protein, partial [Opitutales bacterium]|nr:Maf family protein [Opitutales bacterium]